MFQDLAKVPGHDDDPRYYTDWGDPREFTIGDMGVGECAGEVVSLADFDMAGAEGQVFEAQLHLEDTDYTKADAMAYGAMLQAARGLIKIQFIDIGDNPDEIVKQFRERFYQTELFFDRFAGGKFAQYLFRRHAAAARQVTAGSARQLIEEAQLFLEAAHACHAPSAVAAIRADDPGRLMPFQLFAAMCREPRGTPLSASILRAVQIAMSCIGVLSWNSTNRQSVSPPRRIEGHEQLP